MYVFPRTQERSGACSREKQGKLVEPLSPHHIPTSICLSVKPLLCGLSLFLTRHQPHCGSLSHQDRGFLDSWTLVIFCGEQHRAVTSLVYSVSLLDLRSSFSMSKVLSPAWLISLGFRSVSVPFWVVSCPIGFSCDFSPLPTLWGQKRDCRLYSLQLLGLLSHLALYPEDALVGSTMQYRSKMNTFERW